MSNVIEGLYYAKSHEWARVEGDEVTIGITDHAQGQLGDIVYLELPGVGTELTAGSPFGVVESVKTLSDLIAPISGEVIAINDALSGSPETVNSDPFGAAWLVKVKASALAADLAGLMNAADYTQFCAEHAH